MSKMKIAICGYDNLGQGVEKEITKSEDMELSVIFTRRDLSTLEVASDVPVVSIDNMDSWVGKIGVVIMCRGSATDLPNQVPNVAKTCFFWYN